MMPRFDLMRNAIERLRSIHKRDAYFLRDVYASAYGKGFYSSYASEYAKNLLND